MRSYAIRYVVAGCLAVYSSSTPSAQIPHVGASLQSKARTPYTLASGFPTAKGPAAVVYTPALRRDSDESRGDVQSEPDPDLMHAVMSADAVLAETRIDPGTPIAMEIVASRDTRLVGSSAASRAVWVKHDPARREPQLQGTEFFGVAVGAFRRDQLCSGCYLVLYRLNRAEGHKRLVAAWAVVPDGADGWR
jgi:hypothetical protein